MACIPGAVTDTGVTAVEEVCAGVDEGGEGVEAVAALEGTWRNDEGCAIRFEYTPWAFHWNSWTRFCLGYETSLANCARVHPPTRKRTIMIMRWMRKPSCSRYPEADATSPIVADQSLAQ